MKNKNNKWNRSERTLVEMKEELTTADQHQHRKSRTTAVAVDGDDDADAADDNK